jgi:hypothetical protein
LPRYARSVLDLERKGKTTAWERQPTESLIAYGHFVRYRDTPIAERSLRRLPISPERAFTLSRKHRWVARTAAYDAWLLELGDATAKHASLAYRARLVRLSSALLDKSLGGANKLNDAKLSVGEIALLGKAGRESGEAAFGLQGGTTATAQINVGLNVAQSVNPAWLSNVNQTVNRIEPVVNSDEQVLGEGRPRGSRTVRNKSSRKNKQKLLPAPVAVVTSAPSGPPPNVVSSKKSLKEQIIDAPIRRND